MQHEMRIQRGKGYAAGAADRLVNRPRGGEAQRQRLDPGGQPRGVGKGIGFQPLAQQPRLDPGEPGLALQVGRHGA